MTTSTHLLMEYLRMRIKLSLQGSVKPLNPRRTISRKISSSHPKNRSQYGSSDEVVKSNFCGLVEILFSFYLSTLCFDINWVYVYIFTVGIGFSSRDRSIRVTKLTTRPRDHPVSRDTIFSCSCSIVSNFSLTIIIRH